MSKIEKIILDYEKYIFKLESLTYEYKKINNKNNYYFKAESPY